MKTKTECLALIDASIQRTKKNDERIMFISLDFFTECIGESDTHRDPCELLQELEERTGYNLIGVKIEL